MLRRKETGEPKHHLLNPGGANSNSRSGPGSFAITITDKGRSRKYSRAKEKAHRDDATRPALNHQDFTPGANRNR